MPRPFENQNDPWYHDRTGGRPTYANTRLLKANGGLNLQRKDVDRRNIDACTMSEDYGPTKCQSYGPRTCHRVNQSGQWKMEDLY